MRYLRLKWSFSVCSCLRVCTDVQCARGFMELTVMLITTQKGISMDGVEACSRKTGDAFVSAGKEHGTAGPA